MDDEAKPVSEMEKRVFGHDAQRGPDGQIIEQGMGSPAHLERIKDAASKPARPT
jgi:hypothetical protein